MNAIQIAAAVRNGSASAVDIAQAALARAERLQNRLGAFAALTAELALEQAAAIDAAVAAGTLGEAPLAGVPLPIKDLVEVAGVPYGAGSAALRGTIGQRTDVIADRLHRAGSVMLGKTSTPEFGFPCYTEPDGAPPAATPWDPTRGAGGSSGGAAVAVAASIAPLAHGSDGGGSLRIPAASCGLVGHKASRGLIDTMPSRPAGPGLVTDGVLARSASDAALALDVLAPGHRFLASLRSVPRGLRIGVTTTPFISESAEVHQACADAVSQVVVQLSALRHEIAEAPRPFDPSAWAAFDALWTTGAASIPLPPEADPALTPMTRWLRQRGATVTGVDYARALAAVQQITFETEQQWQDFDLVLTPTLAQPPAPIGSLRDDADPAADFAAQIDYTPWTSVANLTGRPSISLPLVRIHIDGVMIPIGVMFTGRVGQDGLLLRLAAQLQQAYPWPRTPPHLSL
ncbi:MAG: amidase [Propioniciclava sp.]